MVLALFLISTWPTYFNKYMSVSKGITEMFNMYSDYLNPYIAYIGVNAENKHGKTACFFPQTQVEMYILV